MKIRIVNFQGYIKWLVTTEVIFVDPLYLDELLEKIQITTKL
ncbi:hypothetical protein TherJR_0666 [Thermincola potens JR]|uniref:Uncharacterized protein n=1 Tax=Thermincola potens (strain JR) TaxID=635013 RepID=D5XBY8_THEPJ|nr:hypothetical protein TherJR_0666 [Thermincola potens JR]